MYNLLSLVLSLLPPYRPIAASTTVLHSLLAPWLQVILCEVVVVSGALHQLSPARGWLVVDGQAQLVAGSHLFPHIEKIIPSVVQAHQSQTATLLSPYTSTSHIQFLEITSSSLLRRCKYHLIL
ncbi:hypothetical protein GGR54DRAFT_22158 [Hypoxylon sp. NC1633]|nr:hypothetical protein GGR54DRAFT_22158 [Hypoxylon sp. NC1633]